MSEPCKFHPDLQKSIESLVGKAAEQEAYSKIHHDNIKKVFEKVDAIKTSVDQNEIRAINRDQRLDEIKTMGHESAHRWEELHEDVANIQKTVDNGLNARIDQMSVALANIVSVLDRRKKEREAAEAEFGVWRKFFSSICRSVSNLWEKNGILIIFFIVWLAFGGNGHVWQDILKFFLGV